MNETVSERRPWLNVTWPPARAFRIMDSSNAPLSLAITTLRQQTMGVIDYGSLEAGVVVMALPCLILFFALQGQYVRGFMSGAIKG